MSARDSWRTKKSPASLLSNSARNGVDRGSKNSLQTTRCGSRCSESRGEEAKSHVLSFGDDIVGIRVFFGADVVISKLN